MAKIEQGRGRLLSVDTENSVLKFREIQRVVSSASPEPSEWEWPHALGWKDREFFDFVGNEVEYVLSDGVIVRLNSP